MALKSLHLKNAVSNKYSFYWFKPHKMCKIIIWKRVLLCSTKKIFLLFLLIDHIIPVVHTKITCKDIKNVLWVALFGFFEQQNY